MNVRMTLSGSTNTYAISGLKKRRRGQVQLHVLGHDEELRRRHRAAELHDEVMHRRRGPRVPPRTMCPSPPCAGFFVGVRRRGIRRPGQSRARSGGECARAGSMNLNSRQVMARSGRLDLAGADFRGPGVRTRRRLRDLADSLHCIQKDDFDLILRQGGQRLIDEQRLFDRVLPNVATIRVVDCVVGDRADSGSSTSSSWSAMMGSLYLSQIDLLSAPARTASSASPGSSMSSS